jgi:hypothetical protein
MTMRSLLLATAASWIAFVIYLRVVVPAVEGQSADRVPEIDLLGVLRVEQPGAWMALFPEDAWQRDQNNRNIIHADGNIVMFRDYQHEADQGLRVRGLTLLLFEETPPVPDQAPSEGTSLATATELATNSQRNPVVIEALDDAILTFDKQKAVGLNRYGDLKQIQFLGQVKFWRASANAEERFTIQTRELLITGSEATTAAPVAFEFGATNGLAQGLQMTFENSGSLHSANAALTKIVGVRHMRLQRIERLEMLPERATQPISLSCEGPAEFSFSRLTAKMFQNVCVVDHDTGYEITGQAIFIQFKTPEQNANTTPKETRHILPQEMTAKDLWVYGPPAQVFNREQEFQLRSAVLHYVVDQQEFVAGPLPKTGLEPWMLDATHTPNAQDSLQDVEVERDGVSLRVPTIRYRATAKPTTNGKQNPPKLNEGELVASGPGTVVYRSKQNRQTFQLSFQDRLLANPDPEDNSRWLISILGQTEARLDEQSSVQANALYLWMHQIPETDPIANAEPKWEPDLLLAQGQVRMLGEKVRAAVREARVYFPTPQPEPVAGQGVANGTIAPREASATTPPSGTATVSFTEPDPSPQTPLATRGSDVTADSMIIQLKFAPSAPETKLVGQTTPAGTSPPPLADVSAKYNIQTIDLDGDVVVEEALWNNSTSDNGNHVPAYRMFGDRIVGIASASSATLPSQPSGSRAGSPEFVWTVSATPGQPARLLTTEADLHCEELHFDQTQDIAWTDKPGTISFVIPAHLQIEAGATRPPVSPTVSPTSATSKLEPGRGSAKWQSGMQFNGRDFVLRGEVQLEMERPQTEDRLERLQAFGERLLIELSEPVRLNDSDGTSGNRTARRLALYPADQPNPAGVTPPVRVYHQQRTQANELLAQEVVWATTVELEPKQNNFRIAGPGRLWSIRRESGLGAPPTNSTTLPQELTYLKVQFQRSMEGQWSEGEVQLFGPVSALYGKAADWQVTEQESRLRQPLQITSDTMTINRWQANPRATPELEWEADGRVHVLGQAFEGTAQRINFAQSQDLLTLRGDGRAPAKFWQTNGTTSERNHLSAQKIWYRPKQEDFHFEGFQEGNLNFFSGRRGSLSEN